MKKRILRGEPSVLPGAGCVHLGRWVDLYSAEYGAKTYRGFSHSEWLRLRAALLAQPTPGALDRARAALAQHREEHPPQQGTLLPSSGVCHDREWHILEVLVATLERGSRYIANPHDVLDSDARRMFGRAL